eukprot:5076680-Pyramimonas_sp.AAC.1
MGKRWITGGNFWVRESQIVDATALGPASQDSRVERGAALRGRDRGQLSSARSRGSKRRNLHLLVASIGRGELM